MTRDIDLSRFYEILGRLEHQVGGPRTLRTLSRFRDWPERGIYFFFEPGEFRSLTASQLRVVRVGTHALTAGSRSTLRQRLSQHRGGTAGEGNHRGSIFRLLVGQALIATGRVTPCKSWGRKGDPTSAAIALGVPRNELLLAERPVEQAVSRLLSEMPFLWLHVDDQPGPTSLRGVIEQNAIALLSNFGRPTLDPPSVDWLGRHSDRTRVRESGLWNQRHVDEPYDPSFLDYMEAAAAATKPHANRGTFD